MLVCPECRQAGVGFDAPRCEHCGWQAPQDGEILDLVSGQDRRSALFSAYADLYDEIAGDDLASPIQDDALLDLEAQKLVRSLRPLEGQAVCDIGVGRGMIFNRLLEAKPRLLVGLDLARAYLERLSTNHPNVRLVRANAENLPFREEFDVIVASDVMEHVLNVADFLGSTVDALRPGGRLLVKVPFRENISQYRQTDGCPYPMVHLRTFDRPLLLQTLEDAGLGIDSVRYSGFYNGRWQPPLARLRRTSRAVGKLVERRYGKDPGPNRMQPRLARLLIRPVVISVVASKPTPDGQRVA